MPSPPASAANATAAVSSSAGTPAQPALADTDANAARSDSLPSGAFLTEAALGEGEVKPTAQPSNDAEEQKEPEEEDEFAAFQLKRAQEARKKAEAEESAKHPSDEPSPAQPSSAADQSLVVHAAAASTTRKSKSSTLTSAPPPPRAHLFAYTSLFGTSRTKIAAARSHRLQAIEAQFDTAMTERTLEASHRTLLAQIAAEEAARDKIVSESIRAQQKQYDRIKEAQRRKAAQDAAALESVTQREMEALAAERRAAQRKHDAALAAKEVRRLAELRTRALIETHKDITARWTDDESQALDRFYADREARLKLTKQHRASESGAGPAWRRKVEALNLKDPMVVQHALGYAHPHPHPPASHQPAAKSTEEKSAESGAGAATSRSTGRTRLPPVPGSGSARNSPRKSRASASSPSPSSSSSPPRRRYRSPLHGKAAPRHANRINDYHGDNGLPRPADEPASPCSEDEEYEEAAALARRRRREPVEEAARRTPGGSVAVNSRSSVGAGSVPRSPSSRYELPRKHSTVAEFDAAESAAADSTTAASAGDAAAPLSHTPAPEFSFWCNALECAAALEPVGVPAAAAARVSAEAVAQRAQEEQRLMAEVERQFREMFTRPTPVSGSIEGEAEAAAPAPAPLTYSLVVSRPAAVRVACARGVVASATACS